MQKKQTSPTPAELLAWSETVKYDQWQTIHCATGSITFGREAPGMICVVSRLTGLMARVRFKELGPTVGWDGPIAPVPCPPFVEGVESDNQREQMAILLAHLNECCLEWLGLVEAKQIREEVDVLLAEVSSLRRNARGLRGAHGDPGKVFRDQAKAILDTLKKLPVINP